MASRTRTGFLAYPSSPSDLAGPITEAALRLEGSPRLTLTAWPQLDVFGAYIPDEIRSAIEEADIVFADVTRPNLNVFYEIGFGIGIGKAFAPLINGSFANATASVRSLGLFDNIGYKVYENSEQLIDILQINPGTPLLQLYARDMNFSQPLYVVDTLRKTNFRNAVVSAVKSSRSHYRSFDPLEVSRISVVQLISEITASSGVVLPYLPSHVDDAERHNFRVALTAGLAQGLMRAALVLTDQSDENAPTDYRDTIVVAQDQQKISHYVNSFCSEAVLSAQDIITNTPPRARSVLQTLSLGSSAAENEFRDLRSYFVETAEYLRASRGEVNVITGRKGSGKSAIFFQARDHFRRRKGSIVVDLKPESHQLSAFREQVLSAGDAGVFGHTIAAFWYFVSLSEILYTVYRRLEATSRYDGRLLGPMREIEDAFEEYNILDPGDFTSRLTRLSSMIANDLREATKVGNSLSVSQVTNLVYRTSIGRIRDLIIQHSDPRLPIVFLFDNIDKGWPATGVTSHDATIVRLLIESLNKLRSDFASRDRDLISIVFLRHDVYDLVMDQTPDRGKSGQVSIDWTDRAKLAQVVYRRLQSTLNDRKSTLAEIWSRIFPAVVEDRGSLDYLMDHCLMRPRFLLDIIEGAIANGINRGHQQVESSDCIDAVKQHSLSLIDDFGYEMRDVSGMSAELLYALIGAKQFGDGQYYVDRFCAEGYFTEEANRAFDLMLWYGLLGIRDAEGVDRFIYDYNYNLRRLQAEIAHRGDTAIYVLNLAMHVGLST